MIAKIRRRARLTIQRLADRLLERRYGVESSRRVALEDLGLADPDRVWHDPSDWVALRRALARLGVTGDDVFVDFGSGLGRAVFVAAGFPFRRVLGVELSPELTESARRNLERFRGKRRAGEIELVTADALEFPIPKDLTVAYMYSPFKGDLFARVFDRLLALGRPLRLVYNYPYEHNRLIDSGRVAVLDVSPRSWPERKDDPADVIVTYLVGGAGAPPQPRERLRRKPEWLGRYDPGFKLEPPQPAAPEAAAGAETHPPDHG
jgi:SAM-dependent methyltransferase